MKYKSFKDIQIGEKLIPGYIVIVVKKQKELYTQ